MMSGQTATSLTTGYLLILCLVPFRTQAETFEVTKLEDTADGLCDSDCSLRGALVAANGNGNAGVFDVVVLPPGIYSVAIPGAGEDGCLSGDLDVLEDVKITGSTFLPSIVDGSGLDRVFDLYSVQAQFFDLTIRGGSITGRGGGLRAQLGAEVSTLVRLERCLLENNTSSQAGSAISANGTFVNTTFSGNFGDAVHASAYPLTLLNVTFAANVGAALTMGGYLTSTNVLVSGFCTFWGFPSSQGGNLESPGDTCGFGGGVYDQESVDPADLLLGTLSENGGPSRTHAVGVGSVALNAGAPTNCPLVDQRGSSRDGACDIGAKEGSSEDLLRGDFETGTYLGWSAAVSAP